LAARGAVLHASNKPGELSQWLCHDDSTINIGIYIIIIIIIIGRESRFLPTQPAFDAPPRPLGGPRRNIAITFDMENGVAIPGGEKKRIPLFVSTGYTNMTDEQADGHHTNGIRRAYA